MPELIPPTVRLHLAWLDAHNEWGPGLHEDGFGLTPTDDVVSSAGFSAWVARLLADGEAAPADDPSAPRCIYRWMTDGAHVLGGIALRCGQSEFIDRAGHIGYGIRPSARRRGLATWALGEMLDEARRRGIDRVLLVCEDGNEGSSAAIARNGGVLEDIQRTRHGPARRYWIDIT